MCMWAPSAVVGFLVAIQVAGAVPAPDRLLPGRDPACSPREVNILSRVGDTSNEPWWRSAVHRRDGRPEAFSGDVLNVVRQRLMASTTSTR